MKITVHELRTIIRESLDERKSLNEGFKSMNWLAYGLMAITIVSGMIIHDQHETAQNAELQNLKSELQDQIAEKNRTTSEKINRDNLKQRACDAQDQEVKKFWNSDYGKALTDCIMSGNDPSAVACKIVVKFQRQGLDQPIPNMFPPGYCSINR